MVVESHSTHKRFLVHRHRDGPCLSSLSKPESRGDGTFHLRGAVYKLGSCSQTGGWCLGLSSTERP